MPTDARTDRRFPHIADMLTYQRNMLDETIESASRLLGLVNAPTASERVPEHTPSANER